MKTKFNLFAAFVLLAGVSMVPQVARAQLVLTPPCTNASLTGSFGYELLGYIGAVTFVPPFGLTATDDTRAQVGLLTFDGAGNLNNKFTESILNKYGSPYTARLAVNQGTYRMSPDCTSAKLVLWGGVDTDDCVNFKATFAPTPVLLGLLVPGPPLVFLTDAKLECTDFKAQKLNGPGKPGVDPTGYTSTYKGTMAQQ